MTYFTNTRHGPANRSLSYDRQVYVQLDQRPGCLVQLLPHVCVGCRVSGVEMLASPASKCHSLISVLLTNTVSLTAPLNPHRLIKLTSRYHKSLFCMLLGPFRFTSFYALRLFAVSPGMFQGAQRKYRP